MDNPCNTHTDFNCLANALLLLKLEGTGTYIPLPSLQVAYGPHTSLNDAKAFLADAFGAISNVPRGYTFCVIENNKPLPLPILNVKFATSRSFIFAEEENANVSDRYYRNDICVSASGHNGGLHVCR